MLLILPLLNFRRMKQLYWILIFVGLSCAGFSCKGKSHPAGSNPGTEPLQKGIVMPGVSCKGADYTFALYLPSKYDSTRKWPVIFAFDPHGDGLVPVNLCKDEAEKHGYILIGSNDSRNGLPFQTNLDIFSALLADALARLSLDPARIQVMGFSGGARVAGVIAMTRPDIRAVIGCSAGLPDMGRPLERPFDYLGVAGMSDMNFLEMKLQFDQLDKTPLPHFLLLNNGKHAWPPADMIPEIFDWLDVKAMKDKLIAPDQDFLATITANFNRDLVKDRKDGDPIAQEYVCRKAVHYLEGFPQGDTFIKELAALKTRPEYKTALARRAVVLQREKDDQLKYTADLYDKPPAWWKKEIQNLDKKSKSSTSNDAKMMYGRLLGFLSLTTYTLVNQTMRSGAWEAADHYNQLYALIDPENAEPAYIAAILNMKLGKETEALKSLQEAIDLGFNDAGRMQNDTSFTALREKAEFMELVGKAGKNPPKTN